MNPEGVQQVQPLDYARGCILVVLLSRDFIPGTSIQPFDMLRVIIWYRILRAPTNGGVKHNNSGGVKDRHPR